MRGRWIRLRIKQDRKINHRDTEGTEKKAEDLRAARELVKLRRIFVHCSSALHFSVSSVSLW